MMSHQATEWRIGRTVTQCNKYMLQHEVDCDVTFVVGPSKDRVKAHKYMLISRSAVFHSKLTSGHGQLLEIQVPDIEPNVFKKLLMFIYTEEADIDNCTSKLFQAAIKYQISGLITLCLGKMMAGLSKDNVCHILKFAYEVNDVEAKTFTLEYFLRHAAVLINSNEILELPKLCVEDILHNDRLSVSEEEKYEFIAKWAESECRRQNIEPNDLNKQTVIGHLKTFIRFSHMSMDFFSNTVANQGILTSGEKVKYFQDIITESGRNSQSRTHVVASNETRPKDIDSETRPKELLEETAVQKVRNNLSNCSLTGTQTDTTSAALARTKHKSAERERNYPISQPSKQARLEETEVPPLSRSDSVLASSDIYTQSYMETDPTSSSVMETGRIGTTVVSFSDGSQPDLAQPKPVGSTQPFPENVQHITGRRELWRFGGIYSGKAYKRDNPDAISLIPSHSIKLHGIKLYGSIQREAVYKINMQIQEAGVTVRSIANRQIATDGRQKDFLLDIDPPMSLTADKVYSFKMVMNGPVSFYGRSGDEMVTEPQSGVTFTFIPNENDLNGTSTEIGQFPGFVFEMDQ